MKRNLSFEYFGLILRALSFYHFLNLVTWRFFFHNPDFYFKYPLFSFLVDLNPIIHFLIFSFYSYCSLMFLIKQKNHLYGLGISFCLFYFIVHDKFSYHHDIFLAANIFFIYSLMNREYFKSIANSNIFNHSMLAMKVLLTIVYFFAGFHKLNSDFTSGLLIESILTDTVLYDVVSKNFIKSSSVFLSYSTIIIELLVPILIWTRFKSFIVSIAIFFHVGISLTGKGILFNSYLPLIFVLFFNFNPVVISKSFEKYYYRIKFLDPFAQITFINNSQNRNKNISKVIFNILFFNPLFIISFIVVFYQTLILIDVIIYELADELNKFLT